MEKTVAWYLTHNDWVEPLLSRHSDGTERRGLGDGAAEEKGALRA